METHLTPQATSSLCYPQVDFTQRDDGKKVTASGYKPLASKPLWSRSVVQSRQVSEGQLKELIFKGGLANDVLYEVHDTVYIDDFADLKTLSGNFSVAGGLFIRDCPSLQELSADIFAGGSMYIFNCHRLRRLSGSVCVHHCFLFYQSQGLTEVSGNVFVGGKLAMMECFHLENIPGTINVKGDADLSHCRRLRDLSGNFTVCGDLNLQSCRRLTNLSGTFFVGGNIYLDNCLRLSFLPDWISSLGPTETGRTRTIGLECTGLSTTLVDQIRSAAAPGMKFRFTEVSEEAGIHFHEPEQAFAFWWEQACSTAEIPELDLHWEEEGDLLVFLSRLTETADFQDESSRPALALRVMTAMTALMDDQLRGEALSIISTGTGRDNVERIRALNDLETLSLSTITESLTIDPPPLACKNPDPQIME